MDDAKIKAANFNSKSLNALFSAVTNEEFKKISSIETAKEAWTILQTTYEGTKTVKDSKLQRLTTSFEEIKMEEDESFDELCAKLKDIVNSAFNLGKTIPKPKIVRKVLRFLPERFNFYYFQTLVDALLPLSGYEDARRKSADDLNLIESTKIDRVLIFVAGLLRFI